MSSYLECSELMDSCCRRRWDLDVDGVFDAKKTLLATHSNRLGTGGLDVSVHDCLFEHVLSGLRETCDNSGYVTF